MHQAQLQPDDDQLPLPIAYRGRRTWTAGLVEAQQPAGPWIRLDPRLDLRRHSPAGFEWGYGGAAAAQLALALAASRLPDDLACIIHQRLKRALVQDLRPLWHIDAERLDQLLARLVSDDIAHDLIRAAAAAADIADIADTAS
jgi:hypothetical protein